MPQVQIPDVGLVNFPDSMSHDDIVSAIKGNIIPQHQKTFLKPEAEARAIPRGPSATAGGPPVSLASPSASIGELATETAPLAKSLNEPLVPIPKFTINPGDSKTVAVGKEAVNLAAGIPEFLESPAGAATAMVGGFIPRTVAGLFTAQTAHSIGSQLVRDHKDWDTYTPAQKAAAVTDIVGEAGLAGLLARSALKKPPTPPMQGPLATGRVMATPEGAKPPVMPDVDAGTDPDAVLPSKEQVTGPVVAKSATTATPPLSEKAPNISDKNTSSEPPVTPAEKPQIPPSSPATAPAGGAETLAKTTAPPVEAAKAKVPKRSDMIAELEGYGVKKNKLTGKLTKNMDAGTLQSMLETERAKQSASTHKAAANEFDDLVKQHGHERGWITEAPDMTMGSGQQGTASIRAKIEYGKKNSLAQIRRRAASELTDDLNERGAIDTPEGRAKLLPKLKEHLAQKTDEGFQADIGKPRSGSEVQHPDSFPIGTKFEYKGEKFTVASHDIRNGTVKVEDGRVFGTKDIQAYKPIEVDKGTVKLPGEEKPALSLDQPETIEQQKAREASEFAAKQKSDQAEALKAKAAKPLVGSVGDIGQGDLLGGGDLFSAPSPIPQGPGAKTASEGTQGELPESLESGTSLKNATADLERVTMGLPEATPTDRQEMGAAWQKAVNSNPLEAKRIADAIMANPRRSLTGDESALLLKYKVDLGNALNNAAERTWTEKTPEGKAQAQVEVARFSDEFNKLLDAIKERGSEWGREGRWRQAVAQEDYSFAAQERLARAAKGTDLSGSERQQLLDDAAKYKRIADALEKHIAEKDKRISELEAAKVLADIERSTKPTIPDIIIKTAEKFVAKLDTAADAARKRSMERWKRTSAGIDPTMLTDAAIIGASHIAHIGLDFAKWSARMVEDLGDAVKPHLQTIYEASQKQVDDLAETAPPPIKAKVKRVVAKMDVPTKQTTIKAKIAEKFKTGKRGDIANDVAQLAKTFVEQGIRGRDALIDAVHQALQEVDPEITRRQTMDAISGYGDFRQVSKDVISVVLRDLKGQMQQVGKLEDMAAGKAPLKTGFERRTPSDEERRLQKQVAEKKKEGGYTSRDPESELRSALQTAKTVVENQIKDLTKEIETRERIVKERRQLVPDQELTDLKAKRDELKKQHDEVFFNSELSHAEKVKRATALLDAQIKKVEEQLKTGEIFPPGKPKGEMGPLDPKIEIRRQRLQELKDRRSALRESSQPSVVPEVRDANALAAGLRAEEKALKKRIDDLERQIASGTKDVKTPSARPTNPVIEALKSKRDALKQQFDAIFGRAGMSDAERLAAWKKRAQDSIEEYQRRLDEKDYATKPKRPITMDAEAQKLLAEKEAISKKFKARLRDWKRANLPKTERAFDWVSNVRRFSVLSGVNVLGKLAAYSATKVPTMALGELAGNINRLPGLRNVAEKAPSEGENSLPILSRAVAKGFTKGIQDAWSVLRTGKSDLKTAYSNRLEEGWQWYNIPQQIHEVIKSPLRRVAFENSLAKRMNRAAKNGADITDPFTQLALAKDAYLDSDRALLLEQNKYAAGIRQMFDKWSKVDPKTGHAPFWGKAWATAGRIELPILTVPFNYMKQMLENAFGLITGTAKYAVAVRRGLETLQPEEADAIARHFKYGSIGAGMLLWGFFDGYNNGGNGTFGGFYQPGEKRRPDQAGVVGARIMGHNIPGLLLHNPMISVAQLGHTIGAIAASKIKKTGEKRGLTAGLVAGSIGLLNQSPVGSATELVSQLSGPSSEDYALGTHVKGLLIPQLIQEAANYLDRDANGNPIKRDPHGVPQYLESGLPFLRENLPVKVEKLPPGVQREIDKLFGKKS